MKPSAMLLMALVLAGCAGAGMHIPGPEQRAARNQCEAMRSYRPYYPNECGEEAAGDPPAYRRR